MSGRSDTREGAVGALRLAGGVLAAVATGLVAAVTAETFGLALAGWAVAGMAMAITGRAVRVPLVVATAMLILSGGLQGASVGGIPLGLSALVATGLLVWRVPGVPASGSRVIFAVAAVALLVVGGFWTSMAYGTWGYYAIRDFVLWVFPALAILGWGIGHRVSETGLTRWAYLSAALATIWFLSQPWRPIFEQVSIVGYQSVSFLAPALLAFWIVRLLERRSTAALVAASAALGGVILSQTRGGFVALFVSIAAVMLRSRDGRESGGPYFKRISVAVSVIAVGFFGIVLFSSAGALGVVPEGRLGPVTVATAVGQLSTIAGGEGPGSGSLRHRLEWWEQSASRLSEWETAILGVGPGVDLAAGFRGPDGKLVRKPHNDYLEVLVRFGIPIGLVWIGCVAAVLRLAWRHLLSESPGARLISLISICIAVTGLYQPVFSFEFAGGLFFFLAGVLATHLPRDGQLRPIGVTKFLSRGSERTTLV